MRTIFGFALLFGTSAVFALQPYCEKGYKPIADKDFQLDLSKLNQVFTVYENTTTPPSLTSIVTQVNLCDPLPIPDDSTNGDECLPKSLVCRKIANVKNSVETVNVVQTIARDADNKLKSDFKAVKPDADPTETGYTYSLTLNGGEYNKQPQSAVVTIECDSSQSRSDNPKDFEVISYTNNVLSLHWKTVFACATKVGEKVPEDDKKPEAPPVDSKQGMSGIGIFFTILFVLLGVYFIGGAFYNFKVYNARGLDLIPHRDFWLDLPYLIKDLFAHVVDSVMSRRRGSGGYVAV